MDVFSRINEAAAMAGLSTADERVVKARSIARLALADGRSDEEAYEFARGAIFPQAATVAA